MFSGSNTHPTASCLAVIGTLVGQEITLEGWEKRFSDGGPWLTLWGQKYAMRGARMIFRDRISLPVRRHVYISLVQLGLTR